MTKNIKQGEAKKPRKRLPAGTPRFSPDENMRAMVEMWVASGIKYEDICSLIPRGDGEPIKIGTLLKCFKQELARGIAKANGKVAVKLFQAAMDGNITAQIFWLKTRAKWREADTEANALGVDMANVFVVERLHPKEQPKSENDSSSAQS